MSDKEKLMLPIVKCLYPNIKLATSFRGVYYKLVHIKVYYHY